ncbi:MAG: tetratricopeptide repeat protein [Deltaproteobacteria bacterium]|nr:tetratricopeptide repeat protein [Candidatus Tharpella aukensis]
MFRSTVIIFLFSLLLSFGFLGGLPASADEYDDAKVAFGAFEDGLYEFAGQELEQFRQRYPKSKMLERVRLVLVLCSLETGDCRLAETVFAELEKPSRSIQFGIEPAALKLRLARCFLLSGDEKKAQDIYHKLINEHPQSESVMAARFELARLFFAEKNFVAANRVVTPLLATLGSTKTPEFALDSQTVYWIAALSRYQLKAFKATLPLLLVIVDEAAGFNLTNGERQDLYAITIESAWHCKKAKTLKNILSNWFRLPEKELDLSQLIPALRLAADLLQSRDRLADIRGELVQVVGYDISKSDKIVLYGLLIEIERKKEDSVALKNWLKAVIPLQTPASPSRLNHLRSLLLLNYQQKDFAGAVRVSRQLLKEDKNFWQEENFYFPYLSSLNEIGNCSEIVRCVPSRLPSYDKTEACGQRRCFLDLLAGNCLQKLARFDDAVAFYRLLYSHYGDPLTRVKLLDTLHGLAARIDEGQKLDDWISSEVVAQFSLDKRENEKLLRGSPELVLLVADHFFRAHQYAKAQPSLLWLEKLDLQKELADQVTFLLAEVYFRCEDPAEALVRYQALYENESKEFRYLAALRLVTIYEAQGSSRKRIKLYEDLIAWEQNPILKAELKRKFETLKATDR